jgi:hypothetical protein
MKPNEKTLFGKSVFCKNVTYGLYLTVLQWGFEPLFFTLKNSASTLAKDKKILYLLEKHAVSQVGPVGFEPTTKRL